MQDAAANGVVRPLHSRRDVGLRRVAMLSLHTSPLEQPGTGDAGGMNVYVVEVAKRLAERDIAVEIFTRATSGGLDPVVELAPGVLVRHLAAGPYEPLPREDLPAQLCALASGVLRAEASRPRGWYDLVHSHYWLSGQVGWLAKERWGVPLVHSMHTMARVENAALAVGDSPEPALREIGETQVVEQATRLVANTADEARVLIEMYDADPERVDVIHPGVDLETFSPGDQAAARARLGLPTDADVLLFVGRIQPLKAPDVLLRAAALLRERRAAAGDPRPLHVVIVGGPSGTGLTSAGSPPRLRRFATRLGIADLVQFEPPVPHARLADWYRAASVTAVPSYSESFGLVAVESQACGTPVVAAAVGGLRTAVADGASGRLVDGHEAADWATVLADVLDETRDPARAARLSAAAVRHAGRFGWDSTADAMLRTYDRAIAEVPHAALAGLAG
jgi:D-inositol-3-phosphate glycosyltransferase